jgi:hypothetical protein
VSRADTAELWLNHLFAETVGLLAAHWRQVEALAGALREENEKRSATGSR